MLNSVFDKHFDEMTLITKRSGWMFILMALISSATGCKQDQQPSETKSDQKKIEVSGSVTTDDPVEFSTADEPVKIGGTNLTDDSLFKIYVYASSKNTDELIAANEFPTDAYKLEFNAPAKTYLKIVAQRNDGAKYMAILPPVFSDDINAKTKIDRTTTLATKIFEIITKNSKSEDQDAITAVAKNTLAVHDLVQMARSIDSSMTEQKKSQTSSDNAFMNILASFAVKESNKLFDSIVSGGQSSDQVQKNLSDSAYKTMFGTLAENISPGILAHRVNDNYNSVDVAYIALIETWKVAPNSMYPVVSAFQLEATAFRTARTAESAAESEATVKSRYETTFPNCFSASSTTLGSCVDLGYAPPLPPSN